MLTQWQDALQDLFHHFAKDREETVAFLETRQGETGMPGGFDLSSWAVDPHPCNRPDSLQSHNTVQPVCVHVLHVIKLELTQ